MLTVGALGGGGFLNLELDANGLQRLEAALEFGAQVELDLAVAKGYGYILAGIYYGRDIIKSMSSGVPARSVNSMAVPETSRCS
jgi:hypothetical protein